MESITKGIKEALDLLLDEIRQAQKKATESKREMEDIINQDNYSKIDPQTKKTSQIKYDQHKAEESMIFSILAKTKAIIMEIDSFPNNHPHPNSITADAHTSKQTAAHHGSDGSDKKGKARTKLTVEFPDGEIFNDNHSNDNFANAIEKLGADKVDALNITIASSLLIDHAKSTIYDTTKLSNGKHLITQMPNAKKKEILDQIFSSLYPVDGRPKTFIN